MYGACGCVCSVSKALHSILMTYGKKAVLRTRGWFTSSSNSKTRPSAACEIIHMCVRQRCTYMVYVRVRALHIGRLSAACVIIHDTFTSSRMYVLFFYWVLYIHACAYKFGIHLLCRFTVVDPFYVYIHKKKHLARCLHGVCMCSPIQNKSALLLHCL